MMNIRDGASQLELVSPTTEGTCLSVYIYSYVMELVEISMLMLSPSACACIKISHLHSGGQRVFLLFAHIVSSVV